MAVEGPGEFLGNVRVTRSDGTEQTVEFEFTVAEPSRDWKISALAQTQGDPEATSEGGSSISLIPPEVTDPALAGRAVIAFRNLRHATPGLHVMLIDPEAPDHNPIDTIFVESYGWHPAVLATTRGVAVVYNEKGGGDWTGALQAYPLAQDGWALGLLEDAADSGSFPQLIERGEGRIAVAFRGGRCSDVYVVSGDPHWTTPSWADFTDLVATEANPYGYDRRGSELAMVEAQGRLALCYSNEPHGGFRFVRSTVPSPRSVDDWAVAEFPGASIEGLSMAALEGGGYAIAFGRRVSPGLQLSLARTEAIDPSASDWEFSPIDSRSDLFWLTVSMAATSTDALTVCFQTSLGVSGESFLGVASACPSSPNEPVAWQLKVLDNTLGQYLDPCALSIDRTERSLLVSYSGDTGVWVAVGE